MEKIDWSKAPENAIGKLVTKERNIHHPQSVFASEVRRFGCMIRGKDCNGDTFSASDDSWEWIDRPVDPWTGTGLPPVGTVCEMLRDTYFKMDWQVVTFICSGQKKAFFRDKEGDEWSRPISELTFRPIRTPEQIAAEQREKAIKEMLATCGTTAVIVQKACEDLFDSGFRKF